MMAVCFPDYQNSLVNLAASIEEYYQLDTPYEKLPVVQSLLKAAPRNVVLLVLDGLGSVILDQMPADSFLRQHLVSTLSSVFPPTTTAATTSLMTGMPPAVHGWLAWALYFPETNCNVALFRNTVHRQGNKPAADYPVADTYLPLSTQYQRFNETGRVRAESVSPFGTVKVSKLPEVFEKAAALCREPGPHYLYCYWPGPDDIMHDTGVSSPDTLAFLAQLDQRVEAFCSSLKNTNTLVLVTADHGLVDVSYRFLCNTPKVAAHLIRPTAMESRCPTFYVRPGEEADFVQDFEEAYGQDFLLFSKEEVLRRQLFGPGSHPRLETSLGDFLAVATGPVCLVDEPCSESERFRAGHAGMTEAEMKVPLIAVSIP